MTEETRGGEVGIPRKSGHRGRTGWRGRRPRRCHSRASRLPGCRGRWCGAQSRGSGPESGSLRCRGGRSSRRCRRRGAASPSSPAWRRQQSWEKACPVLRSGPPVASILWSENAGAASHPSSLPLNSARASFFSLIFSSSFFRCRSTMTLFRKLIWRRGRTGTRVRTDTPT